MLDFIFGILYVVMILLPAIVATLQRTHTRGNGM
jgi:hypothetical protein